jgi:seryl-tRNA synthetase
MSKWLTNLLALITAPFAKQVHAQTNILKAESDKLKDAVGNAKQKGATQTMALQDELTALTAQVTNISTVVDSATALINGFKVQLQAAYDSGIAAGATPVQLQGFQDLGTKLDSESASLAAAVAANTTPPAPAPTPAPTPAP